jgi:isopentenyl-diphosphate delta-isomerase
MEIYQVILVNEQDDQVGVMEKMAAHQQALLHRAFSVFIFNKDGQMLLQKRADSKYHSPGLWTNACCSHPAPGETTDAAAKRRLQEELGFITDLKKAFHFTYKAAFDNGLTEYEFDHVYTGVYDGPILPDPQEASEVLFLTMDEIEHDLKAIPEQYTVWFAIAFPMLKQWVEKTQYADVTT